MFVPPVFLFFAFLAGFPVELEACDWSFAPKDLEGFGGADLSPYTKVVWPSDRDNPTACVKDS